MYTPNQSDWMEKGYKCTWLSSTQSYTQCIREIITCTPCTPPPSDQGWVGLSEFGGHDYVNHDDDNKIMMTTRSHNDTVWWWHCTLVTTSFRSQTFFKSQHEPHSSFVSVFSVYRLVFAHKHNTSTFCQHVLLFNNLLFILLLGLGLGLGFG